MARSDANVQSGPELLQFSRFLNDKRIELQNLITTIYREEQRINMVWGDKQNEKFTVAFESYLDNAARMCENMTEHSKFVEGKAKIIIELYNGR